MGRIPTPPSQPLAPRWIRPARLALTVLLVASSSSSTTSTGVLAFMPEEEGFQAPSLEVRGALKTAMIEDYEDVIVMQAEMAWGAQEMKKYKSIRGAWPVRSELEGRGRGGMAAAAGASSTTATGSSLRSSSSSSSSNSDRDRSNRTNRSQPLPPELGEIGLLRRKGGPKGSNNDSNGDGPSKGEDYWTYLISIF